MPDKPEIVEFKTTCVTKIDVPPLDMDLAKIEERILADLMGRRNEDLIDKYLINSAYSGSTVVDAKTNTVTGRTPFGPDSIRDIGEQIAKITPYPVPPMGDRMTLSAERKADFDTEFHSGPREPMEPYSFGGIKVQSSPMFPYTYECSHCEGTGEGIDSTYCKHCKGAGEIKVEGIMQGATTVVITGDLPKAFQPSFPAGLVPKPKLCRGLP